MEKEIAKLIEEAKDVLKGKDYVRAERILDHVKRKAEGRNLQEVYELLFEVYKTGVKEKINEINEWLGKNTQVAQDLYNNLISYIEAGKRKVGFKLQEEEKTAIEELGKRIKIQQDEQEIKFYLKEAEEYLKKEKPAEAGRSLDIVLGKVLDSGLSSESLLERIKNLRKEQYQMQIAEIEDRFRKIKDYRKEGNILTARFCLECVKELIKSLEESFETTKKVNLNMDELKPLEADLIKFRKLVEFILWK